MVTVKNMFGLVCFLLRHFSGEDTRSQLFAITGCPARGLFGPLSGDDVQPPAVLAFDGVRIGEAGLPFSVKGGTDAVKRGGILFVDRINLVVFAGYSPPSFISQNGGPGCPVLRRPRFCPNTMPEKKTKKLCVLGMGCGCHVMPARQNIMSGHLGQARAHVPRRVFFVSLNDRKNTGVYPPLTISHFLINILCSPADGETHNHTSMYFPTGRVSI